MNLVSDPSFDDRQQALVVAILNAVIAELEKVEAPSDLVKQLAGSIGFAVTSLIDDSASVPFESGELSPMLTFAVDDNQLAFAGGNTWMHEYVYRLLPKILAERGVDSDGEG